jgi:hypothetical protein
MRSLNLGSRKIQLIKGTFFISLPRIWARNFDIKQGSKVGIFLRDDGSLEINLTREIFTEVDASANF